MWPGSEKCLHQKLLKWSLVTDISHSDLAKATTGDSLKPDQDLDIQPSANIPFGNEDAAWPGTGTWIIHAQILVQSFRFTGLSTLYASHQAKALASAVLLANALAGNFFVQL